jgi:protein Shroom
VVHVRQKSQEEIAYEQHAKVVASQLPDGDKSLVEVIVPPPEHKTTCDYMTGIFSMSTNLQRRSSRAAQLRREVAQDEALQNGITKDTLDKSKELTTQEVGGANTTLERQKEELVSRLEQKLDILRKEKRALEEEVKDNVDLGKQIQKIVEEKCQNEQERNKYRLYVDELDKVMYLLLKLSGRLARAENAVRSLPDDASEKERAILTAKRDELSGKHEDAKQLKEGIDRRSHLVASYLRKYLSEEEFGDYEYFIQMKSKLNMDSQEIEDKIKLGEEQLLALRRSINTTHS